MAISRGLWYDSTYWTLLGHAFVAKYHFMSPAITLTGLLGKIFFLHYAGPVQGKLRLFKIQVKCSSRGKRLEVISIRKNGARVSTARLVLFCPRKRTFKRLHLISVSTTPTPPLLVLFYLTQGAAPQSVFASSRKNSASCLWKVRTGQKVRFLPQPFIISPETRISRQHSCDIIKLTWSNCRRSIICVQR